MAKSTIQTQMEKIFRHTRQNSFATRDRYEDSCRQFVTFLHDRFKLQNIRNVSDKHVVAFVEHRQQQGMAAKTIKNDLGAVRYLHDHVSNPRFTLSDNAQLKKLHGITLEKTPQVTGDRAWTVREYSDMKQLANTLGRRDVADVLTLARTMGLRIAEAVGSRRAQAEAALRSGVYPVQGEAKNGKHRDVPLSPEGRQVLQERLANTPRGGRLFVDPGEKMHRVVNRMEKFLEYHRPKIESPNGSQRAKLQGAGSKPLTFHGLRYNYVQQRMDQQMAKGFNQEQAAAIVSKEVGHERIDVIKIYQGGK